ncbi:MAG: tyrosine-protein phosphatase [Clostridiales bacterium]|nr:tyrosine-protein phosphatase [Clostridiales bacterium]
MKNGFLKSALSLALCVGMAFGIAACGDNTEETEMKDNGLSVSKFDEPVALVDESVLTYMNVPSSVLVSNIVRSLGNEVRQDKGLPVTIEYDLDKEIVRANVSTAKVKISENKDLSDARSVFFEEGNSVDVYNLKTGKKYYFQVSVKLTDGSSLTENGEFETVASPRFMNVEGTNNVRDVGGWTTESGKKIKQGILYRGSEIDGGKNTGHVDFCLTEKGVEQLRALGIKTDFDLREESCKVGEYSILGEDVSRNFYNAPQYQSVLNESSAETVRKLFSDLANPEAYPAYIHCTHGVDRAGTASLLLESLLGVAKEDLVRDYELSAFYYNYAHVNRSLENGGNVLKLLERLEKYEGKTLADKTAAFLLSVGVTQEEIDSIRNIFLG